jgi:hypothetical protein
MGMALTDYQRTIAVQIALSKYVPVIVLVLDAAATFDGRQRVAIGSWEARNRSRLEP